jgi:RNA polymerase-associated protein
LLDLNPYNTVPTLVDRDLVLYDANIIMEYLDERFPHPPLLPVYPIARAKMRLLMFRIEQDWYSLVHKIENADNENTLKAARKALSTGLIGVARLFGEMPYFLSEEFTLVDCCLAPLLWRLPHLGIELPAAQSKAIYAYARRIFTRDSFIASLTEAERELPQ